MSESGIITNLPREFIDEYMDDALGRIPAEKVKLDLEAAQLGKIMLDEGPLAIEALGQKLGEIPARIWFRWNSEFPGCWQNKEFVREFFRDNKAYRSPGWMPKTGKADLRHSVTFVGGNAVSNLKTL